MKNIALALSSGGPRGFAYIGAIEELLRRGYSITSVSGASAGALIGGIYAAGGLPAFKEWLLHLDPLQIVAQLDIAPSKNYLLKGDKIIETIKARVPEVNIEDLPIPFTAVATDLHTGEEVLFREGPLFDAIRASISIPSMFRPVKWQGRTLIDGGITNTFPLNRAARTPGDILVGFNVNRIDAESIRAFLEKRQSYEENEDSLRKEARAMLKDSLSTEGSLLQRMKDAGEKGSSLLKERIENERLTRQLLSENRERHLPVDADDNYASILQRSFGIMNQTIARMGIELCPPDILVNLPFDSYHGIYGYTHAAEIVERGRTRMAEALDAYEEGAGRAPGHRR